MKRLNSRNKFRGKYGLLEHNGHLIVCVLNTGVFVSLGLAAQLIQTPKNLPELSIGDVWRIRSKLRLFPYTEDMCRRETDWWVSNGYALSMDTKEMEHLSEKIK